MDKKKKQSRRPPCWIYDRGRLGQWNHMTIMTSPVSKSSVFKMSSVPAADPGEGPTLNWWKWGPKGQKTYLSQGLDDRRAPPPPSLSYIWIHRCVHTNTACWRFFFHFKDVVEKFRFRWRIYLDSCGLVWTEGAGPEKYSSVFKFIRHTADRALGKQESTKLKPSICDVKMSRVCTTVLNSPSCLVFISGYANTENVFHCLSIIMTFKERWTTFRGQTTATPQCDFLPC